ncbi:MAG: 50S ribosomal protein L25/general stress protein Ctc [Lentilitoribacter sp.]|jgi:large subunit ribosomal protein L25
MSDTLKAVARERVGKGSARELRRNGQIPASIYGDKQSPVSIAISRKEATMRIHAGGFMTNILSIDVDGEKVNVLPKDYQLDPVRDFVMHVDFLRVSKNTQVVVEVPVQFENEDTCVGIKRGGTLNVVRHTVEVSCPANSIPEALVADLAELNIGDAVHISAITLPEGVTPTITDRDFTVATIASPGGAQDAEDDAAEAAAAAAEGGEAEEASE